MSFNGSGTFLINSAGQPVVTNTIISSTAFNALTADLATGLSTCLTKDGQTTPTANIKLGGFKLTNVGAATLAGDALSFGNAATISTLTLTNPLAVTGGGTGAATLTGVLKGNGTSAFTAATAGTDYVSPTVATNFTATQTFTGSTSQLAAKLINALEKVTISATAATGTIAYNVTDQSVLYYTTNASANWTLNVRGNGTTSLNALMATGESVTIVFLVTNGGTAYYQSAFQIDGASVTPKWQGGTAPTSGNASSIDAYTITIVKTGSAAFTAFAAQSKFA
jgi:hypothetical protein